MYSLTSTVLHFYNMQVHAILVKSVMPFLLKYTVLCLQPIGIELRHYNQYFIVYLASQSLVTISVISIMI